MKKITPVLACLLPMITATMVHAYDVDKDHNRIVLTSVEDFERCQEDYSYSDACFDALKRYVKTNPKTGFAAGKAVRARFNHWMALQFFAPVLTKATAEAYCGDEDLRMAVLSGLALPTSDANQSLAAKVASGVCTSKLQPAIRNGFGDGGAYYQDNACAVLSKLKVAAPPQCGSEPATP